jgi:VanZ family protein
MHKLILQINPKKPVFQNKRTTTFLTNCNYLLKHRITRWFFVVFWVYALFLVAMNLTPGNTQPLEMKKIIFIRTDYFLHATAYAILICLFIMASVSSRPVFKQYNGAHGIIVLVLLATIPEALQNFVPLRRFNWWDMFANFTGLVLGTAGMLLLFLICKKRLCASSTKKKSF